MKSLLKCLLIICFTFFISSTSQAQAKSKARKIKAEEIQQLLKQLPKETITASNLKDYPEIKNYVVEVKYSTSSFYVVRSQMDSLKRNR